MDKIPLTQDGFNKLDSELKALKSSERPNIIKAISEAKIKDDRPISQNRNRNWKYPIPIHFEGWYGWKQVK